MPKTRFECTQVILKNWTQMTPGSETLSIHCHKVDIHERKNLIRNCNDSLNLIIALDCITFRLWEAVICSFFSNLV